MNASPRNHGDPSSLADEVRSLANDAYRVLSDPVAEGPDMVELARRIARLKTQVDRLDAEDLSLWLENLRRRIDAPATPILAPWVRPSPLGGERLAT